MVGLDVAMSNQLVDASLGKDTADAHPQETAEKPPPPIESEITAEMQPRRA